MRDAVRLDSIQPAASWPTQSGFFQILGGPDEDRLTLVSKPNTILYQGADLLAELLAGQPNRRVSHFYVGYSNVATYPAANYLIDKTKPGFLNTTNQGYIRVPLTYPAALAKADTLSDNYANNLVMFSVLLNNPIGHVVPGGAALTSGTTNPSRFFEAALVCATNPAASSGDKVFARVSFDPITFDSSYNLTVNWGVKTES